MNDATTAALNRINQDFYHYHYESFSETRSRPWHGWKRLVKRFNTDRQRHSGVGDVASILDVGCGNGRFGEFLSRQLTTRFRYLGVDASAELLAIAEQRLDAADREDVELRELDLVSGDPVFDLSGRAFDLIVVFGLLHHIPGIANRRTLLSELAGSLAPGGMLALSFWQFATVERFRQRVIPWSEHNRITDEVIDTDQLEDGDFLLAWGEPGLARRYCHFASLEEAGELVASLDLAEIEHFRADGKSQELNLYYLLRAGRQV